MYQQVEIKLKTEKYLSLITRLFSYSGSHSKISAAYLASFLLNFLEKNEQKMELITLFGDLLSSELPQVRKNVVVSLKNISRQNLMEFRNEFMELIVIIAKDPMIMVKYHSIGLLEQMATILKEKVDLKSPKDKN